VHPAAAPSAPTTVLRLPDGRDLAFAEYGDPDGVPVMAFHGTPGSLLQLAPAHTAARDAAVRLIALDRPGYGHSTFAPGRLLGGWASDVAAVADHLGIDRFAVLGVSGGGPHALACGAGLPSRLTVVGLVSSPCPPALTPAERHGPLRWLGRDIALGALVRLAVRVLVAVVRRFPLAALRVARRWMPDADRRVVDDVAFAAYFLDASERMSATTARAAAQDVTLFARDWCIDLGGVEVPVRIWHGADDRLVEPWNADVLAKSIPGASAEIVPDQGHLLFAERADAILRGLAAVAAR
jgi:pimeloyl-ACP methyl ester carboxylesterase